MRPLGGFWKGRIDFFLNNFDDTDEHLNMLRVFIYTWPRGYKIFFVLNGVEHEILNAHKYENIK